MHTRYSKHQDQQYFIKLVRSGLKEQEAIDQMALMGIKSTINVTSITDGEWEFFNDTGSDKKNNLPFYHGKRRY